MIPSIQLFSLQIYTMFEKKAHKMCLKLSITKDNSAAQAFNLKLDLPSLLSTRFDQLAPLELQSLHFIYSVHSLYSC